MDLELLKKFYAVAKYKTITRASKHLNVAQSALSRSISLLEHQIGFPLFSRTHRGVILNSKGEALFEHARELLEKNAIFEKKFKENKETMEGEISIVTFPYLGSDILVPALKSFLDLYPDVYIKVHIDTEEAFPIGHDVVIGSYLDGFPNLIQKKVFPVHTNLFASESYLKSHGYPEKIEDLSHHKIVEYKTSDYQSPYRSSSLARDLLKTISGDCKVSFRIDSLHGLVNAALQGYGICELPNYPSILNLPLKTVLEQYTGKPNPIYFIYRSDRSNSQKIIKLYDHLESFFKTYLLKRTQ